MNLPHILLRTLCAIALGAVLTGTTPSHSAAPDPTAEPDPSATSCSDRLDSEATSAEPTGGHWYRLEIDGGPAGWAHDRIRRDGDRVTTLTCMALRLRRSSTAIDVELASRFVEDTDGRPLELWQSQSLGRLPVESTYRFEPAGDAAAPGRVEVITVQAGRETRRTVPVPEGRWLTPDAARRAVLEARREGSDRYRVRVLEPFQGLQPVTWERELLGAATTPEAVDRWRERRLTGTGDRGDETSIVEVDAEGRTVSSVSTFLGLELTLRRTDRASALAEVASGAAPELMVSAFVATDEPIPAPRRLRRAVYELSVPSRPDEAASAHETAALLSPVPETDAQTILPASESPHRPGAIRVLVEALPASGRPPRKPADADAAAPPPEPSRYLASSPFVDHRDPAVRALLESFSNTESRTRSRAPDADPRAVDSSSAGSTDALHRRATRLATFVRGLLTDKSLDTGFATASEVARTRAGDCTEHAVLLAALLRADAIPSRVVSGLVYFEELAGRRDAFGYHMWTQALIDGRWVDLDAALPGDLDGFDATHIALAVSALSDSEAAADLAPVAPLIGRLQIRVLETTH